VEELSQFLGKKQRPIKDFPTSKFIIPCSSVRPSKSNPHTLKNKPQKRPFFIRFSGLEKVDLQTPGNPVSRHKKSPEKSLKTSRNTRTWMRI
jgi:hypothetical protein